MSQKTTNQRSDGFQDILLRRAGRLLDTTVDGYYNNNLCVEDLTKVMFDVLVSVLDFVDTLES